MPKYEIEYICNLSDEKQDELAEAITKIHAEKFKSVFYRHTLPTIRPRSVALAKRGELAQPPEILCPSKGPSLTIYAFNSVPRLFVNVSFKPEEANAYIAGKRVRHSLSTEAINGGQRAADSLAEKNKPYRWSPTYRSEQDKAGLR